jgi:translation initiation factor 3 subunit A
MSKRQKNWVQKTTSVQAENVLKKAEELIKSDQHKIALATLDQAIIGTKRIRNWTEVYEAVIQKYLELCVEFRKGQDSKQALVQYRSICQGSSNMESFLMVTENLVELAETKVSNAQKEVENLVATSEKEGKEVTITDFKNRLERSLVEPWLKFLWDTYRNSLDVLKNNTRLESKYQVIAQKAFVYCEENHRRTEFRKLCELLRTHSNGLQYGETSTSLHIATKFKQLNVGCTLELWQDAYKTVEELNELLTFSDIETDTIFLTNYYEQLVKIFWVSKNYLFHAHALMVLFELKEKELDEKSKVLEATYLLLSILSIPDEKVDQFDLITRAKQLRMAPLLGSVIPPTKEKIMKRWIESNLKVIPELEEIHNILQVEFQPFNLCSKMTSILEFLKKSENVEVSKYSEPIADVTVSKFISQISQIFKTIKIEKIENLVPFMPFYEVEKLIVQKRKVLIDHQKGIITFEQTLADYPLKDQLEKFSKKLNHVYEIWKPVEAPKIDLQKLESQRKEILLKRKVLERMKRWEDEQEKLKEDERQEKLARLAKLKVKEDEERRAKEAEKREQERKKREEDQKKELEAQKILDQLESQTSALKKHSSSGVKKDKKNTKKSIEEVIKEKRDELEREQIAKEKRLLEDSKNMDYLEIIRREHEIPLMKKKFDLEKEQAKVDFETNIKKSKEEYEKKKALQQENQKKLDQLLTYKNQFVDIVLKERKEAFQKEKSEWQQKYDESKAKWEEKRILIMAEVAKREKADEEKRVAREKEEKERKEKEEKERKEKEEAAEKLRKQNELQQEKQREIDERLARQKQQQQQEPDSDSRRGGWGSKKPNPSTQSSGYGSSRFNRDDNTQPTTGGSKYGGGSSRYGQQDGESKYGGGSSRYGDNDSKFGQNKSRYNKGEEEKTTNTEKQPEGGFETVEKKGRGGRWK